jgi:hypothetical protein
MKIVNHEGHEGSRRNLERFTSCTFVPFVVSGFANAD